MELRNKEPLSFCGICKSTLPQGISFEVHAVSRHRDYHLCTLCEKGWKTRGLYINHLNSPQHGAERRKNNKVISTGTHESGIESASHLGQNSEYEQQTQMDNVNESSETNTETSNPTPEDNIIRVQDFWNLGVKDLVKPFSTKSNLLLRRMLWIWICPLQLLFLIIVIIKKNKGRKTNRALLKRQIRNQRSTT